jgi:hypothetical protein
MVFAGGRDTMSLRDRAGSGYVEVAHAAGLTREARNGGKSVGSGVFFACADSALWILYVMCRRQPSSLI